MTGIGLNIEQYSTYMYS